MKYIAATQKTSRPTTDIAGLTASAGSHGIAVAPPAYGLEMVDQGPLLQRAAASGGHQSSTPPQTGSPPVPSIVHEVLRSPGQPLDAASRAFFEPRFGHDFSRVRVHTDARAAESARAVNALAYTVGRDVVFGAGQYASQTVAGQELLAHELTHVVQQGRPIVPAELKMDTPEGQAEEEAQQIASSLPVTAFIPPTYRSATNLLQRQPRTIKGRLTEIEKRVLLLEKKNEAISVLSEFQNEVLAIAAGWEIAARNIGSAYACAADNHRTAIKEDEARAAIENQIMMSILVASTAGIFSWVVGAASLAGRMPEVELLGSPQLHTAAKSGVERVIIIPERYIVDPLGRRVSSSAVTSSSTSGRALQRSAPSTGSRAWEEAGSEAAQQAVGLLGTPRGGIRAVSTDPQVFQNQRVNIVTNAKMEAYRHFAMLSRQLRTAPAESWVNYNAAAQLVAHRRWLQSARLLGTAAKLPSISDMSNEIERGFWAEWAKRVRPTVRYAVMPTVHFPEIGSHVATRLRALGIADRAGLELAGWRWFSHGKLFYESTYDDWQKLKRWAGTFRPRRLFPGTRE